MGALGAYRFLRGPQGYDPEHLLVMQAVLPDAKYGRAPERRAFADTLIEKLNAIGGVRSAAIANIIPGFANNNRGNIEIEGKPNPPSTIPPDANYRVVTDGLLETMRIPIVSGRAFIAADREGTDLVA